MAKSTVAGYLNTNRRELAKFARNTPKLGRGPAQKRETVHV